MEKLQISLLIWFWTTFRHQDSPNSLLEWTPITVSSGIWYHSFWRTSSSCFRSVGGGNLFLTVVSKTNQSGSMMFKSGHYAGQRRCWSSPSNHDWTVLAVWMGTLSSWKTASLFGMHLFTQPAHLLPCSNSAIKRINETNRILYYDIAVETIIEPPPCFTVGTRHSGL
jgi:hypothetical protein